MKWSERSSQRCKKPCGRCRVDPVWHTSSLRWQYRWGSTYPQPRSWVGRQNLPGTSPCLRRSSRRTSSLRRWRPWCPCRDASPRTRGYRWLERQQPDDGGKKKMFLTDRANNFCKQALWPHGNKVEKMSFMFFLHYKLWQQMFHCMNWNWFVHVFIDCFDLVVDKWIKTELIWF